MFSVGHKNKQRGFLCCCSAYIVATTSDLVGRQMEWWRCRKGETEAVLFLAVPSYVSQGRRSKESGHDATQLGLCVHAGTTTCVYPLRESWFGRRGICSGRGGPAAAELISVLG
jgi:hypothetical protein